MGLTGLLMAFLRAYRILTGLTKSTDHPSRGCEGKKLK